MRRKKIKTYGYKDVELNIMPFIDVFSMLNTFLLFSAVFLSVGIIEVQIPFLSTTPPDKEKPTRALKINIDVAKEQITLETSYTTAPENPQKTSFTNNPQGHTDLHTKLVGIRKANPDTDKATVFSDDDVIWNNLSAVLDAVMLRQKEDPVFAAAADDKNTVRADANAKLFVYPKIVMGSVMLR